MENKIRTFTVTKVDNNFKIIDSLEITADEVGVGVQVLLRDGKVGVITERNQMDDLPVTFIRTDGYALTIHFGDQHYRHCYMSEVENVLLWGAYTGNGLLHKQQ